MMKKWWVAGTLVLSMSCVNSYAVEPVTTGVAAGVAAKAAVEGTAAATGAATAAGLIGAGTATALTGAGAGIAAGYAGGYLMNEKFFEECGEKQNVCNKAKTGTYTGATVGTLGSIAALWAADASLAGIGAALGGGAIAGTAALVAAPVVVAALAGAGTYWWLSGDNNEAPADENGEETIEEPTATTPADTATNAEAVTDFEPEIQEETVEVGEGTTEAANEDSTAEGDTAEDSTGEESPPAESEEAPATEAAT